MVARDSPTASLPAALEHARDRETARLAVQRPASNAADTALERRAHRGQRDETVSTWSVLDLSAVAAPTGHSRRPLPTSPAASTTSPRCFRRGPCTQRTAPCSRNARTPHEPGWRNWQTQPT